jgi:hypothetical protein
MRIWRIAIGALITVLFLESVGLKSWSIPWWIGVVVMNGLLTFLSAGEDISTEKRAK